ACSSYVRLLTGRGLLVVARRESERKRRAAADFALDGNRAVKLFDDAFRDREPKSEPSPLRRHVVVENLRKAIRGYTRPRVRHADLDQVGYSACGDRDATSWFGCLNRVGDQVADHASKRKPIAVDHERAVVVPRFDGDAV